MRLLFTDSMDKGGVIALSDVDDYFNATYAPVARRAT